MTIKKIYKKPQPIEPVEKMVISYETPDGDRDFIINIYDGFYTIGEGEDDSFTMDAIPEIIDVLQDIMLGRIK